MTYRLSFIMAAFMLLTATSAVPALEVGALYENGFPNQFFDGPITITSASFEDNAIRVFTIDEAPSGGGGFVIAVSNGENGIDIGAGVGESGSGPNIDVPNPTPVGYAIDVVNGGDGTMGNRVTNGNAFRFSVWLHQDPNNPIVVETSVEPVLKFELWSEAQSTYADYAGRKPFADMGDRLWDTDLNAPHEFYAGYGQSVASPVDISGNGTVVTGDTPAAYFTPENSDEWIRVETVIVIDDDPDDSGIGWDIAGQGFHVDAIEEVRATFFTGDFAGVPENLADGGSFFVDNALLEVFSDEATMLATPNPNPMPTAALIGDYNDNGSVDAADYTVWRDHLNQSAAALANRDPNITGLVKAADYDAWKLRFGQSAGAGASVTVLAYAPATAVPEPGTAVLVCLAGAAAVMARARRR